MKTDNKLRLPEIWVLDTQGDVVHMVGTNHHDELYLDEKGRIQYYNLQNGCGTEYGEYRFVLDEELHDQNNLPFTEEEQCKYGLTYNDAC